MSVFKKIKDVLFDIEEEEEVVTVKKEKTVIEENPIKEIKISKENVINDLDERDLPKKNSNFNFPLDFEDDIPVRENSVKRENIKSSSDNNRRSFYDDDYDIPRRNKSDYIVKEPERKKEEVRDYSKYLQPKKEEKKIFTPSPVISPVYGVLNQNYTKDDVIVKTDVGVKSPSLDEVRKKAYNKVEKSAPKKEVDEFEEPLKTLDEILISGNNIKEEPLENDLLPEIENEDKIVKDEVIQEEMQDVKLNIKEKINDVVDNDEDDNLENDLFNLIDSMYEDKEEEDE